MEKNITSLDEITEANVKYNLLDSDGNNTGKWVRICTDDLGYGPCFTIFRKMYRSQLYDFETKGNYVRSWKTFSGALRFIKNTYSI